MIGYLEGEIREIDEDNIILLVGGVGYLLTCSQNTIDDLCGQSKVALFVHTNVREDAITLFGFSTHAEKKLFLSLIKVNGIGPKVAVQVLSAARLEDLIMWIQDGNAGALTKLPKVGKKKAEQILLTLKGKISQPAAGVLGGTSMGPKTQIQSALTNLGFSTAAVEQVINNMPSDISFQDGVREGLATLSGHN